MARAPDKPDKAVDKPLETDKEYGLERVEAYPVDGINTLGIHNGVVRIQFMRLNTEGKAVPAVEINVPLSQMKALAETLMKAAPR